MNTKLREDKASSQPAANRSENSMVSTTQAAPVNLDHESSNEPHGVVSSAGPRRAAKAMKFADLASRLGAICALIGYLALLGVSPELLAGVATAGVAGLATAARRGSGS